MELGIIPNEKTLQNIARLTCKYYDLQEVDIKTPNRSRIFADARGVFFYCSRKITDMTCSKIGEYMNRDHATVLHSVNKIEQLLSMDEDIRMAVEFVLCDGFQVLNYNDDVTEIEESTHEVIECDVELTDEERLNQLTREIESVDYLTDPKRWNELRVKIELLEDKFC